MVNLSFFAASASGGAFKNYEGVVRTCVLQTKPWGRWGKRDDQGCPAIDPSPSIGNEKITSILYTCTRTIKLYFVDCTFHAPLPIHRNKFPERLFADKGKEDRALSKTFFKPGIRNL